MILVYEKNYTSPVDYTTIISDIIAMFDDAVNVQGMTLNYTYTSQTSRINFTLPNGNVLRWDFYYRYMRDDTAAKILGYWPRTIHKGYKLKLVINNDFAGFAVWTDENAIEAVINCAYFYYDSVNDLLFGVATQLNHTEISAYWPRLYTAWSDTFVPYVNRSVYDYSKTRTFMVSNIYGSLFNYNVTLGTSTYYAVCACYDNYNVVTIYDVWTETPTYINW